MRDAAAGTGATRLWRAHPRLRWLFLGLSLATALLLVVLLLLGGVPDGRAQWLSYAGAALGAVSNLLLVLTFSAGTAVGGQGLVPYTGLGGRRRVISWGDVRSVHRLGRDRQDVVLRLQDGRRVAVAVPGEEVEQMLALAPAEHRRRIDVQHGGGR